MKAHGVPWDSPLPAHPLKLWINPGLSSAGLVSRIYEQLILKLDKNLGVIESWNRDLKEMDLELNWENVWDNVFFASKNPAHQLVHFKFVHKFYISPYRRFKMGLSDTPNCTKCNQNAVGTYLHMFWHCPGVSNLKVPSSSFSILELPVPKLLTLFLFNDDSSLCISANSTIRKAIFVSCTASKKTIIHSWFSPGSPSIKEWFNYFRDIVIIERSLAVIHKARSSTLDTWDKIIKALSKPLDSVQTPH